MSRYKLGTKNLHLDAERLRVLMGSIPLPPSSTSSTWFRIWLVHANGSTPQDYNVDDTGLAAAVAAAISGDTIIIPPYSSFSNNYTFPDSVSIIGNSSITTVFTGLITGGANSYIRDIKINRTDNSGSTLNGMIGPASGTLSINTIQIIVTQSGAGGANALYGNGGTVNVRGCYLEGQSTGGSGYGVNNNSGTINLEEGTQTIGSTASVTGSNVFSMSFDPEIVLLDSSGAQRGIFPFTAAGLTAALAVATSGDVVSLPPGTVSGNNTVPAGVALSGIDRRKTILSGQITLAGANSVLANLSVTRTANDANALIAVICAADVSPLIFNCDITAIQSGSGDAKALQVLGGAGQPRIEYSYIDGQSTGGSGYGVYQEATAAGPSTLTWIEADPNTSQGASVNIVTNGAVTLWEWVVYKLSGYNPSPSGGHLQTNITNNLNSHAIKLMRTDIAIGGTDYNSITGNYYPEKLTLDSTGATFSAGETKNINGSTNHGFTDPGYFILMYGYNNGNAANIQINSIKWVEDIPPYSTIDLWDPSSDTSAISTLRWCRINGSTTDILAGAGGTVKVYACDFDPASISGTIEHLLGDRSAWDTTNYGARHADDWAAGDTHHPVVTLAADADTLLGITGQQLTLDSQNENIVLAGPASAPAADPTFRALVAADIPGLAASKITSGQLLLERGGTEADLSATGPGLVQQRTAGEALSIVKCNFGSASDPTVNDDSSAGYSVGSRWINTTADTEYICLDASVGAAVWTQTTASGATDNDAIHDNVNGEINAITEKASPVNADLVIIEDSAASYAKKKVQVGNLPGGSGGVTLKNRLINGGFRFFQRQDPTVATAGNDDTYGPDRWYRLSESASFQTSRISGDTIKNAVRMTQNQASAQQIGLAQIIEGINCFDIRSDEVTVKARIRSSSTPTIRLGIIEWTGTEDSVTSDVISVWAAVPTLIASAAFAATPATATLVANTWTNLTQTVTLGSTFNNLIIFVYSETQLAQNVTFDVEAVQIEIGNTATDFEYRPQSMELALCQRYFEKSFDIDTNPANNTGSGIMLNCTSGGFGNSYAGSIQYKISKRANPTLTYYNPVAASAGTWVWYTGASGVNTAPSTENSSTYQFNVRKGGDSTRSLCQGHFTADAEL